MNIALVLAGGTGSRLGSDIPKQYIEVHRRPVIAYCLALFEQLEVIDIVWVVAEEKWHPLIRQWSGKKLSGFSEPGENRQLSIWNGLVDIRRWMEAGAPASQSVLEEKLKDEIENGVVLIHDAARPLVSAQTVLKCLKGCKDHDGVMPALPVKDTVYCGVDGHIEALLDRSRVIAGQAPEAFRFAKYYEANQALLPDRILQINGSSEPAVLAGLDVQYIPGDERNFKITTKVDLERFQEILQREHGVVK